MSSGVSAQSAALTFCSTCSGLVAPAMTLATIGRHAAIADFGLVKLTGWVAWVLWGIVHIFFLIGFRNRMAVFLNWVWAWVTYGRGARLITGEMTTLAQGADSTESKRPGPTSPCGTNLELPPKP